MKFVDALNNKLCIYEKEKCPINYIEMGTEKPEGVNITNTINGIVKNMYIQLIPIQKKKMIIISIILDFLYS